MQFRPLFSPKGTGTKGPKRKGYTHYPQTCPQITLASNLHIHRLTQAVKRKKQGFIDKNANARILSQPCPPPTDKRTRGPLLFDKIRIFHTTAPPLLPKIGTALPLKIAEKEPIPCLT